MKYLLAILAAITLTSCGETRKVASDIEQELEALKVENVKLKASPRTITVIKTEEVEKVVQDTSAQMAWLKFIGILLFGAGVGLFTSSFWWPIAGGIVRGAAAGAIGCGAAFFITGLSTQIVLPWLPYFLFGGMVIGAVMLIIYIIRHVEWSQKEKAGIKDIVDGIHDSPEAQQIIKALN